MSEEEKLCELEKIKKAREELDIMEGKHKDIQFKNQLNFLINKVKKFLEIKVTDEEVFALLIWYNSFNAQAIRYYISVDNMNLLLARKVLNRYAGYHEIRYEDSLEIITEFIDRRLVPINRQAFIESFHQQQQYSALESSGKINTPIVVPLFY